MSGVRDAVMVGTFSTCTNGLRSRSSRSVRQPALTCAQPGILRWRLEQKFFAFLAQSRRRLGNALSLLFSLVPRKIVA